MQKILLYYKFVPIPDPDTVRLWQRTLCENLNLKGRILISEHGINGTIGGDLKNLKQYVKSTKASPLFKTMAFKWSDSAGDDFPKLVIKVRSEIVTFGLEDKLKVNETGVVGGGQKLKPKQVHELVNKKSGEVVFFDGRNAHEARIGRFKNAIVPEVDNTRDFAKELKKPKYNDIKDKPVVTYCTGGIRCEVLSKMMIDEGFKEVYQMDGGIVKYGEEYGDQGLWEGSLYVFDGRIATQFSDKAKDIGDCAHCETKTSNYENCENKACNKLILVCENCQVIGKCKDCSLQTVK